MLSANWPLLPLCVIEIAKESRLKATVVLPSWFPAVSEIRIEECVLAERKQDIDESDTHCDASATEYEILALNEANPKRLPKIVTLTDPVMAEFVAIQLEIDGNSAEKVSEDDADKSPIVTEIRLVA